MILAANLALNYFWNTSNSRCREKGRDKERKGKRLEVMVDGVVKDGMEKDPILGKSGVSMVQEAKDQGSKTTKKVTWCTKMET